MLQSTNLNDCAMLVFIGRATMLYQFEQSQSIVLILNSRKQLTYLFATKAFLIIIFK